MLKGNLFIGSFQPVNKTNNQIGKRDNNINSSISSSSSHSSLLFKSKQSNERRKSPNSNFQFKKTKLINYSSIPFLIHSANLNTTSRSTSTSSPPPPPPINDDSKFSKHSKSGYKKEAAKDIEKNKNEETKEKEKGKFNQKEIDQDDKQIYQSGNESSTLIGENLFADKYSDENVRNVVEKATKNIKDTFIDVQESGGGNIKNEKEKSSDRGQEIDRKMDQNAKKDDKKEQKGEDMSNVTERQDRENDQTGKYTGTFKPGSQFDHRSDLDADLEKKNLKNDQNKSQEKSNEKNEQKKDEKQNQKMNADQNKINNQINENINKNMGQNRKTTNENDIKSEAKSENKTENKTENKYETKNDNNKNDQMNKGKGGSDEQSKLNFVADYVTNVANKAGKVINETIDHGIHPTELLTKVKETAENVKDKMEKVVHVVMEKSNKTTPKDDEKIDKKLTRKEANMEEGIVDDLSYKGNEKEIGKSEKNKNSDRDHDHHDRTPYRKIIKKVKEKANLLHKEELPMGNVKMEGSEQENYQVNGNEFTLKHPLWETWQVNEISAKTHRNAKTWKDKIAYSMVRFLKFDFNLMSGFYFGEKTPNKWLTHIIYLETIAGVPSTSAALLRHISSISRLKKDHGWIHSLIEEAENERVHLLTALEMKKPNFWIRIGVMGLQISFFTVFTIYYLISPQFCHRWVGYMEEEAIKSYTLCLEEMDRENSPMNKWGQEPAPQIAKQYWHLDDNATVRDVFLMIRADEAHHRDVNHTFADMKSENANPFRVQ